MMVVGNLLKPEETYRKVLFVDTLGDELVDVTGRYHLFRARPRSYVNTPSGRRYTQATTTLLCLFPTPKPTLQDRTCSSWVVRFTARFNSTVNDDGELSSLNECGGCGLSRCLLFLG